MAIMYITPLYSKPPSSPYHFPILKLLTVAPFPLNPTHTMEGSSLRLSKLLVINLLLHADDDFLEKILQNNSLWSVTILIYLIMHVSPK